MIFHGEAIIRFNHIRIIDFQTLNMSGHIHLFR
ncbi:Uncharacterised protein [Mycobacteroides abscessus subsp. abscessus]|nr:Uncharacterised protein [Mycobacteroides abscessus subsp. abscessus]